jgi:hypothetical protein
VHGRFVTCGLPDYLFLISLSKNGAFFGISHLGKHGGCRAFRGCKAGRKSHG